MPPNFSSTREDGRRRVQAAGALLTPLSPPLHSLPRAPGTRCSQCQPPPPRPFCPAAGPAARSSPVLQCLFPAAASSSSSQGTEAAARQGAGAVSCCKAPSNNWETQRRVRAHLPEIRLLGRNLDFIPLTAASSISSLQLPEVSSPHI